MDQEAYNKHENELEALELARKRAEERLKSIGIVDGGLVVGRPTIIIEQGQQFVVDDMMPFFESMITHFEKFGLEFCVWSRNGTNMDFWMLSENEVHPDLIGEQVTHLILFWKYNLFPEDKIWMLAILLGLLTQDEIPIRDDAEITPE